MAAWRPRSAPADFGDTLVDGVPEWMKAPVFSVLQRWEGIHIPNRSVASALAQEFDLAVRISPTLDSRTSQFGSFVSALRYYQDEDVLDFIDWFISLFHEVYSDTIADLDRVLERGGSRWKVGMRSKHHGLELRVAEGVGLAAEEAVASAGQAGVLLAEAWHAAFGRSPDYEEAYEKAIKAVEEAIIPVVEPNNRKATLGTVTAILGQKFGAWRVPLSDDKPEPSFDALYKMSRALWLGQESRHGANGYRKPTREEAESAVVLAVSLVHIASAGLIAKHP